MKLLRLCCPPIETVFEVVAMRGRTEDVVMIATAIAKVVAVTVQIWAVVVFSH